MTQIIETGVSDGLKIQFIDEMVVLHGFKNISTSKTIQPNVINIECSNTNILKLILGKINCIGINISISNNDDTIILLS